MKRFPDTPRKPPPATPPRTLGAPWGRRLRLRATFAVFLCLLALAGCGGTKDARTHVLLWHQKGSPEREVFEEIVARYNAAHPDRHVEALYHETEELRSLYIIAAVAGQGPDLVYGPSDNVGLFVATQVIRPLDGFLRPEWTADLTENGLVRWRDRVWLAADQIGNQLALVYDRKLVPEPPKTLDDLVALGRELTRVDGAATGRYGLTWCYKEPYFFIPFLTAFGGWVMDDAGRPTLDNDQTVAALQFVLDLRDKSKVIPREGDYVVADMLYKERRAAMIINGPWAWPDYGVGDGPDARSGIAPLPTNPALGTRCTPMYSQRGYSVNVNVPDVKLPLVREVMEFLAGPEVQQEFADRLFVTPVNRAVLASPSVRDSAVHQASLRQVAQARPIPIRPEMRQIWDGMRGPFQLIMSGSLPPREGARLMQRECEKKLADAQM